MSLRVWNLVKERKNAIAMFMESQQLYEVLQAGDDSEDELSLLSNPSSMDLSYDSLSDDETDSVLFSDLSLFSELDSTDADSSSTDTSSLYHQAKNRFHRYYKRLTRKFENPDIQWGRRMLVRDIHEADGQDEFRFRKDDLQQVADKLWPRLAPLLDGSKDSIKCYNGYRVPYETGLLLVLFRFSRPRRYRPEMEKYFGIRRAHLSAALITFIEALYQLALPYLSNPGIHRHRYRYYANLICAKTGGLVDHIWGFIDGTLRKTARPSYFQNLMYSGHKRAHGIKFQSIITPDGLFAVLFGPVNGCRHDSFMLRESKLLVQLNSIMPYQGEMYALYGDPAYPQFPYLYGGYREPDDGSPEAAYNTAMSSVREAVEWNFGDITTSWSYLDWKAGMKIFEKPVAKYYIIAAFFCNIRSFYYDNQSSDYFGALTYTLDQYLALV